LALLGDVDGLKGPTLIFIGHAAARANLETAEEISIAAATQTTRSLKRAAL
jgi:hypothetical protein